MQRIIYTNNRVLNGGGKMDRADFQLKKQSWVFPSSAPLMDSMDNIAKVRIQQSPEMSQYNIFTVSITDRKHNVLWIKISAHTFSSTNKEQTYTNSGRAGAYKLSGLTSSLEALNIFHSSDSNLGQMSRFVWKWFLGLKNGLPAFPLTRPILFLCRPCNFYGLPEKK